MSALEVFQSGDFAIRSLIVDGEPWFVAADVCAALALTNPTMSMTGIDADDLSTTEVIDAMGRTQVARTVSEPGLYKLVFQSRKPEAKTFKRWITHEVLPALRKTGTYSVDPTPPPAATPSELILMLAQQGVDMDRRVSVVEHTQAEQGAMVEQLAAKVDRRNPDDVSLMPVTPSTIGSKLVPPVSGKRVNEMLQECGFQWRQNGQWTPSHEGRPYAVVKPGESDTGYRFDQLMWQERIVPVLERRLARRSALGKSVAQ